MIFKMSGGYFGYKDYNIFYIANEIGELINNNKVKDEYGCCSDYNEKTLMIFRKVKHVLDMIYPLVHAIDYLAKGDHGEVAVHKAWKTYQENMDGAPE
jgi:DNA phosphorothioation-dependent restriction protein DptG